jgi:periplasmic divalent cation tolerance protein
MKTIVIQTSCGTKKEAHKIAKLLIHKKLAACVHMSYINSFYNWENQFCGDKEYLLTIKTKKNNYKKIERKIKENHSYDVPEIIALPIKKLDKNYKIFINESC